MISTNHQYVVIVICPEFRNYLYFEREERVRNALLTFSDILLPSAILTFPVVHEWSPIGGCSGFEQEYENSLFKTLNISVSARWVNGSLWPAAIATNFAWHGSLGHAYPLAKHCSEASLHRQVQTNHRFKQKNITRACMHREGHKVGVLVHCTLRLLSQQTETNHFYVYITILKYMKGVCGRCRCL